MSLSTQLCPLYEQFFNMVFHDLPLPRMMMFLIAKFITEII